MRRRVVGALLTTLAALATVACTPGEVPPAPAVPGPEAPGASSSPTPSPMPDRDFTVGTTDTVSTTDPASMTTPGSETIAFSVFQRLMATPGGSDLLRPDAARDCIFEQATVYTCTLQDGLRFHSGAPVTSEDVKYSLERAIRLAVPGSSAPQLGSIQAIETPDDRTVRFVLAWPDAEIGHALASPAASIVDPAAYPADRVAEPWTVPAGSGPYRPTASGEGVWTFARYESYLGHVPASIVRVVVREYPSSAQLEQAMLDNEVDAVWRGLDEAAVTRQRRTVAAQEDGSTYVAVAVPGARVVRVAWSGDSPLVGDAAVRGFVRDALAPRRTLTSIMPVQVDGAREDLYPAGGTPLVAPPPEAPIALTLGHDPRMPDGADLAADLARTLQATGQATVTVQPDVAGADLVLVDSRAATWTPRAWLQAATQVAGAPHAAEVATIVTAGLTSTDEATRTAAVATIQEYVAMDAYVTPLLQADEYVFVRRGYHLDLDRLGSGWQLDLAAFSRPA